MPIFSFSPPPALLIYTLHLCFNAPPPYAHPWNFSSKRPRWFFLGRLSPSFSNAFSCSLVLFICYFSILYVSLGEICFDFSFLVTFPAPLFYRLSFNLLSLCPGELTGSLLFFPPVRRARYFLAFSSLLLTGSGLSCPLSRMKCLVFPVPPTIPFSLGFSILAESVLFLLVPPLSFLSFFGG